MWKIPLFKLDFDENELLAVQNVIEDQWLTMGAKNSDFERRFAEFHNSKFCLSTSSGTAALHLALKSIGIKQNDEVIMPSFTFVAPANIVRNLGAIPVFCDIISTDIPLADPNSVEKLITRQTKVVIVVHYAGYPCDMNSFVSLCNRHNLKLIEDCAHSPGAKWESKFVGTWGDLGCFSFFSNKNLSMGEGGAILMQSQELHDKIKLLRSHGMTTLSLDRYEGHAFDYDVLEAGFNYRLDEIRAAIGLVQLSKLPSMNRKRQKLVQLYRELLDNTGISLPFMFYEKAVGVDHIMPIFLPPRTNRMMVIESLKKQGIQTSIHYPPIHKFAAYKYINQYDLCMTEELSKREITLPLYPSMSENNVQYVVEYLQQALT